MRAWPAGTGTRSTEPKKSRTAAGIPMSASTFSPRRAVSRPSIPTCASVACGHDAGRLMPAPTRSR